MWLAILRQRQYAVPAETNAKSAQTKTETGSEVLDLLGAVVEDAWKERLRTAETVQTSLAARLRTLDQKRNRLVDAYLGGVASISERTSGSQNDWTTMRLKLVAAWTWRCLPVQICARRSTWRNRCCWIFQAVGTA